MVFFSNVDFLISVGVFAMEKRMPFCFSIRSKSASHADFKIMPDAPTPQHAIMIQNRWQTMGPAKRKIAKERAEETPSTMTYVESA